MKAVDLGVMRKAQPSVEDVHIDRFLTNISVAYIQSRDDYVADRVFPLVPVQKQSDNWPIYDKEDWFRNDVTVRPPSTESAGSGYNLSEESYRCEVYGFHKDIDDRVMANYDDPLNPQRDAVEWITQILLIHRDIGFADTFFNAAAWPNSWTGPADFDQWDDQASDLIAQIRNRKRFVKNETGFMPNKLTVSGSVWDILQDHVDIVDRVKYTDPEAYRIRRATVAAALDLDEIVVAEATHNTAEEGVAADMNAIFGNHALLTYSPQRPSLLHPSAGYTFAWTAYAGNNAYGIGLDSFYMRAIKSTRVEGELAYDQRQVADDMGFFFENVLS